MSGATTGGALRSVGCFGCGTPTHGVAPAGTTQLAMAGAPRARGTGAAAGKREAALHAKRRDGTGTGATLNEPQF